MQTPFLDIPVDAFTLFTSFTYPGAIGQMRRWLDNDRVNALRQSTMYNFKGYVVRLQEVTNQTSYTGQVRALPSSWLFGVDSFDGATRFWDSNGFSPYQGIPISGPAPFQSNRNNMAPGNLWINLDEPLFLLDGILNYEIHATVTVPRCFLVAEPRPEIKGELLSACLDKRAVEF